MSYRNNNGNVWLVTSIITGVAAIVFSTILIFQKISAYYSFEKKYAQLWELSDKSSTISAKQQYINELVSVLRKGMAGGEFATHNAVFLKTPNNEFVSNLKAMETLAERLTEIQDMNPSSFEYNTAIQQITSQEQGEADNLLKIIKGCYTLENYPVIWDWYGLINITIVVGLGFVSVFSIASWVDKRCGF